MRCGGVEEEDEEGLCAVKRYNERTLGFARGVAPKIAFVGPGAISPAKNEKTTLLEERKEADDSRQRACSREDASGAARNAILGTVQSR